MNPIENEDLYDYIVLAGVRSPGVVKLSGHDRKVNWDVKAGQGQSGASVTLKDIPLAEITCTFYFATIEEFAAWDSFQPIIDSTVQPKKTKAPGQDPNVVQTRKTLAQTELEIRNNRPTNEQEIKLQQQRLEHDRLAFDQASKNALRATSVKVMNAKDIYHPDLASQTPPITSVVKSFVGGAVHDGKGGQTRVVRFQEYRPPQAYSGSPLGSAAKKADPNQAALDELDRLTAQFRATPWG